MMHAQMSFTEPHMRGSNTFRRSAIFRGAWRVIQAPVRTSSSSSSRWQHRHIPAAAAPHSHGSSSSNNNSSSGAATSPTPRPAAAGDHNEDADYSDLAADDNIILLGSADEDDDLLNDPCFDPVNNINICSIATRAATAAASREDPPVISNGMSEVDFRLAVADGDPCYDPVNDINVCDVASRAAAAAAAGSAAPSQSSSMFPNGYTAEEFASAASGYEVHQDGSCYDPVNDINICSTISRAAVASKQGGQVVSNAMSEEDFRAAMAAARQQASNSSSEDDGGWGDEQAEQDDGFRKSAEDFWSTEKERVYLVGVTYKQQYQQQQLQQQRRQHQQRQNLFSAPGRGGSSSSSSSSPRMGGLGMTASSYSPLAAATADSDTSSSSKSRQPAVAYSVQESLEELGRLAETAGLQVVGSSYQALEAPNNATYIGSGKVAEVARAISALKVDTVIFDDELSPGQLRNLEKAFSGGSTGTQVAVADRTALILDIFNQRARTKEGKLQVELAQVEYQLPRLTRMWSHLDRVAGGGQVKGTGEKQIEIDKRLLRDRAAALRRELQAVRTHRAGHRSRRQDAPIPVVALVGYTNAGKSTLLNTLTDAGVLAEDKLFATLDPTTRKVRLPGGNLEVLFSDTVGFIQKLPTQLVAAFRATLEEIASAAVVLHVLDVSADNAPAQCAAVLQVLEELGVQELPLITAWNKIDACADPSAVRRLVASRSDTVAISGATGEGLEQLMAAVSGKLAESMVEMEVLLPYSAGALLDDVHKMGKVTHTAYTEQGTHITARVPRCLVGKLQQYICTALPGSTTVSSMGSVLDDGDNGQLETLSEDELFTDYVVDNASLEGIEDLDEDWQSEPSDSSNGARAAPAAASDGSYQPHSVGSRAGKRAERRQRQQQQGSLAQHQLPAEWLELVMSGASSSSSSVVGSPVSTSTF